MHSTACDTRRGSTRDLASVVTCRVCSEMNVPLLPVRGRENTQSLHTFARSAQVPPVLLPLHKRTCCSSCLQGAPTACDRAHMQSASLVINVTLITLPHPWVSASRSHELALAELTIPRRHRQASHPRRLPAHHVAVLALAPSSRPLCADSSPSLTEFSCPRLLQRR
jgi:hypothetical protein